MPSFYQADLFRGLTETRRVDVKVFFSSKIPEERARLGWLDDLNGFEYEFLDPHRGVADAIKKAIEHRDATHIVGGLWAGRVPEVVLATLFIFRSRYFIYSEAPDPQASVPPIKGRIMLLAGRAIVKRAAGLFPISHFATNYFKSYGADTGKIHPFGYFRSLPPDFETPKRRATQDGLHFVFVGQLVKRKGLDILLSAMEPLFTERRDLKLHLIGSGEMERELQNWIKEKKLMSQVFLEGSIDSQSVIGRISQSHLLILPSRWDGWGIVVNEALMVGIPVVVSDMCGAADVIRDGVNGYVFHSEDVENLRRKLTIFLRHPGSWRALGAAAGRTGAGLSTENASRYLVEVFKGKRDSKDEQSTRYPWVTV